MQELTVKISHGEAFDKLSILNIKIDKNFALAKVEYEYMRSLICSEIIDFNDQESDIFKLYESLKLINQEAWDVVELHLGAIAKNDIHSLGRHALEMHNLNIKRIKFKNKISEYLNGSFFEVKSWLKED